MQLFQFCGSSIQLARFSMTQDDQSVPKGVKSWKLNSAEKEELTKRVEGGETEEAAKYDIQLRKARANESRKKAANAVAKVMTQTPQGGALDIALPGTKSTTRN